MTLARRLRELVFRRRHSSATRKRTRDPQKIAGLRAAEERQREAEYGPSPLKGVSYGGPMGGEYDLFRFFESSVDTVVSELVDRWAVAGAEERQRIRASLRSEDFGTLFTFALRMSLRALREKNAAHARHGLTGAAFIDADRWDWRDASTVAQTVGYALHKTATDVDGLLIEAASMAEPKMGAMIRQARTKPTSDRVAGMFREVQTPGGVVLLDTDFKSFEPRYDLVSVALDVVACLERDVWRARSVTIETELPAVWFSDPESPRLKAALRDIRACADVSAELRPSVSADAHAQHLIAWIAEAANADDARFLAGFAGPGKHTPHVACGAHAGPVCAIIVARAYVHGCQSYEQGRSLDRFVPDLREILAKHVVA